MYNVNGTICIKYYDIKYPDSHEAELTKGEALTKAMSICKDLLEVGYDVLVGESDCCTIWIEYCYPKYKAEQIESNFFIDVSSDEFERLRESDEEE